MDAIQGSPYVELEFNKAGRLNAGSKEGIDQALAAERVEDLVVLSHGWKFEGKQPRDFYDKLWPQVTVKLGRDPAKFILVGVVWPSKRYTTGIDAQVAQTAQRGNALSTGDSAAFRDLDTSELAAALTDVIEALEPEDPLVFRETVDAYLQRKNSETAASLLQVVAGTTGLRTDDPELASEAVALRRATGEPAKTLTIFADPPRLKLTNEAGNALGLGRGIAETLRGPRAAVIRVLEQFSYFEMKKRAGTVGASLGAILTQVRPARSTRLHLVGHSFGARLVTAAADGFATSDQLELFSLTLLQGAFSHNGLSQKRRGAFHRVVGRPIGPIAITHTHKDWACTVLYALASRLSRDMAQALGDKNDPFGSMGANGAQFAEGETPATIDTALSGFRPRRGTVTNFRADGYIKDERDAHNDVTNPTVGELVASVLKA